MDSINIRNMIFNPNTDNVLDSLPINKNELSPVKFGITFSRNPEIKYFLKSVNLPGISCTPSIQENMYAKLPMSGNKVSFNELRITFRVDEDLKNWIFIKDWILASGRYKNTDDYKQLKEQSGSASVNQRFGGLYTDITVHLYTGTNNPNIDITFEDAFPSKLEDVNLDSSIENPGVIYCTAEFQYARYEHLILNS